MRRNSLARNRALLSTVAALTATVGLANLNTADASSFSVASTPGAAANGAGVIGQNFSPSQTVAPEDPAGTTAAPSPVPAAGTTVYLNSFTFTKSNTYNTPSAPPGATNTYLVIEDGGTSGYPNFNGLTTATVTGVSTNSVDTTYGVANGTPLTFNFNNLAVPYGDTLTAALATVSGTAITFITADLQIVNFTQAANTNYYPDTNYGGGPTATNTGATGNYNAAALYTFGGSYFGAGSDAEDTVFTANFSTTTPEPASIGLISLAGLALAKRRRH